MPAAREVPSRDLTGGGLVLSRFTLHEQPPLLYSPPEDAEFHYDRCQDNIANEVIRLLEKK